MTTHEEIIAAAERLNIANVAAAQKRGRLYRDHMTPEARNLDEVLQAYYEAQKPSTNGPQPLPPTSVRVEIDSKEIGFTLKQEPAPLEHRPVTKGGMAFD